MPQLTPSTRIGQCICPECGFPDAEVRTDKSAHAYRYCPDCGAKYFTLGQPVQQRNLIKKIQPAAAHAA